MDSRKVRVGVQLFTLRETGDDFATMTAKVAALGYDGVELAAGQLRGVAAGEVETLLARSGLVVASAHVVAGSDGLVPVADLDALQS